MQSHQIDLIRDSFVAILFERERAAAIFYRRLFELAPETRPLFSADLTMQGQRLIQAVSRIVTGLDRFDAIAPMLRDLAIRHVAYGVEDRHYAVVGEALMTMVADLAEGDPDAGTGAAWGEAYTLVADEMRRAADTVTRVAA